MTDKKFPQSGLPIRKTVDLLPTVFQTEANDKFMSAVVDPLVQPGVLQKLSGYVGRRYGKTYNGKDVYLDTDGTLRSRYQLEPGVNIKDQGKITDFYDYLDFKNQIKFFGNTNDRDDLVTSQKHYSWNPPIDWDKFINYREYYWEPAGPPSVPVFGQKASVVSTYRVSLGSLSTWIFYPDGYTSNPTITLYRGQTYKFVVDAPNEGFAIRTNYDTGSLLFNTNREYPKNSLTISNGKLWRAKATILAGSYVEITEENGDWQFVELITTDSSLDYNQGVTNNGIQNGTLTFTVPYDAPDVLFYQSLIDPDRFGRFLVSNIESNTTLNVDKEIIGKKTYKSSNGIEFTNGLVIEFRGNVSPAKYSQGTWLIEGVGKSISLVEFNSLIVSPLTVDVPEVVFDNEGFDTQPFDDATTYPAEKDYITIARHSVDYNPWSRYNRWFHRSVLEYAYSSRGQEFTAAESSRAKRPIIEFLPNIQLFNHGSVAKEVVDYVDTFTDDVFSKIEGSTGYSIDGEALFEGARILVIADTDSLANNRIYEVNFITHNNRRQITLRKTADSESVLNECVLVRRGNKNSGIMYHYNGENWVKSQRKTQVNQPPLYDIFDENGDSFSDPTTYPISTFAGSKILSYKTGNGSVDSELGFQLSYLNINNVGDIQFSWDLDLDFFRYTVNQTEYSKKLGTGYYRFNNPTGYANGWTVTDNKYIQPIIDSVVINEQTNEITLTTVDWNQIDFSTDKVNFYLNGSLLTDSYTRNRNTFSFSRTFAAGDSISVKIIASVEPLTGYYEIPVSLEKNPLNQTLDNFTLGQAIDHVLTALEFSTDFSGTLPGVSNLRDISDYSKFAKRFLRHDGLAPLAISLLCDKTSNIIKSIQYAKKSYTTFKNNFLVKATELPYNDSIVDFVDDIIADLTKTKSSASPFADSDMIGSGAYTSIEYKVEDVGIKTFSLTEKFNLTELSRRAVYVYINGKQLLNTKDYEFNSTFGFVTIKVDLQILDLIQIREYVSTSFNHIPPTPTSLGLYKKYTPMMFVDDTYREPKEVIQGHDGSITFAYGDFRDELLLELEYRIYNNIKQEYDPSIFDIDSVIGGYYDTGTIYKKPQLDAIVNQEFLKWIQNTNINYTLNEFFVENEPFTYTYSNMTDPTGTQNLPGWWRGVYQWFYDTDRPHRCPWEMLGFSEQPDWWEEEYGAAPYTSGNLILWEDLAEGIIRQGPRAGIHNRYKRSTLLSHLPVDGDGNLVSPLDSGLAGNYVLINNKGSFVLGDISPVEHAWRTSPEWPFAVTMAMCLMKPFEFITDSFDRSRTKLNVVGHTVNSLTGLYITLDDIVIPDAGGELSAGLVKYLASYLKSRGVSLPTIQSKIQNIDVNLSSRLSGFVDKAQQKYLLDSKNPNSTSGSIFVPQENYDIIFNVSAPIAYVEYSGVILEKVNGGWVVSGYDDIHPYFKILKPYESQSDALISVGGVTEDFVNWEAGKSFGNGQVAKYRDAFYRALKTHISNVTFDTTLWKKIPKLSMVGAVEAFRRTNFELVPTNVSYGSQFNTIQQVVDFLLGYEAYLKSQGFKFDRYDPENQVSQDWLTSSKEFMFWTRHNWAVGSLITLSPSAEKINIDIPVGVADNILDGFYDYQVLKVDGKPLTPNFINVNRQFQNITVETVDTTEGIYYLRLYYVLKEHVAVFDDRTVFNDIIYDKPTGYRQERVKEQGFRTVDWDGDYTSPGFLFDNVNIQTWQPFTDYKLGDIVSYRSYNWTSLQNQLGTETFDDTKWSKLDTTPEKQLVANFDYKINLFEDYYDVASDGIGEVQRTLARHSIGYQTRDYLQNLAEDSVTQFQLYQGFIREKGTSNAITKVFNKLSRSGDASVSLYEEWAFRVGRLGGIDQLTEIEFNINKKGLVLNPQPILLENTLSSNILDQYYRVSESDFTIKSIPFTFNTNPTSLDSVPVKTAGYVNPSQVDFVVKNRDDILNLDIANFVDNNHVWITFDSYSWTVLRYNISTILAITGATKSNTDVTVRFNRKHGFNVGEIIGFREIPELTGFFKINNVTDYTVTLTVSVEASDPKLDESTEVFVCYFSESRSASFDDINESQAALLKNGSKLWIDNNGSNLWEVIEKKKQFTEKLLLNAGISDPRLNGSKVIYDDNLRQTISSIPGSGYVMVYSETPDGLTVTQIIPPPTGFAAGVTNTFGLELAISPDSRWLIIGSPKASGIPSNFYGEYNKDVSYLADDIVTYQGRLWRAREDEWNYGAPGDSTWIDFYTQSWEPAASVPAYAAGRFPRTTEPVVPPMTEHGVISIYEWSNQQWQFRESLLSARPAANEKFGSSISIGVNGTDYYMAVSAPGSLNGVGRVYLYKYVPNESLSITFDGSSVVNYATNTLTFLEPHNFYNGEKVTYINGTLDGREKSTATEPSPPADNTEYYVIRVDQNSIRLAETINDVNSLIPLDLKDIGIDDSSFHTLIKDARRTGWQTIESGNYKGIYNPLSEYRENDIVWYDSSLWLHLATSTAPGDGSTIDVNSADWRKLDPISTQSSLPTNIALSTDTDTLDLGILSDSQLAEMVKVGDQFGHSVTMSRDGSVLVVGAPNSDGQYFANYRGIWRPDVEYTENDVVKHDGSYYKLQQRIGELEDSTTTSYNEDPSSPPWEQVGDSTLLASGKIYIYQRSDYGTYDLKQTISTDAMFSINDIESGTSPINSGDQFGWALDINNSGSTLVVTSPKADINFQNQGSAYVFSTDGFAPVQYRLKQKLESFEIYPNEYFGQSVCMSPGGEKIVIGAKNTPFRNSVRFDTFYGTTFDQGITRFTENKGYTGGVYVFDKKADTYFLTEKLESELSPFESFGYSVSCSYSAIAVGSPDYVAPNFSDTENIYSGPKTGTVRLFRKDSNAESWNVFEQQKPTVDISKIKSIVLYDNVNNKKIQDVDYVDPAKLKILNVAEQELTFKTVYDPAVYNLGTDEQIVEPSQAWADKHVGELWWNISTAKWVYYEQSDLAYKVGNWNLLAPESSIDIYEWIETPLLPSEWSALADTNEGIAEGISGQPLYPNDDVYSKKELFNSNTGQATGTLYYYWVRNKTVKPENMPGRRISAAAVASYISNPAGTDIAFISLIDKDKFLAYNFNSVISSDVASINIQYYKNDTQLNAIHNEYQLLTEGVDDNNLPVKLENKWIDSLVGSDTAGNRVPDPSLMAKQKYGIEFRPRQSMFVDRMAILKILIGKINTILLKEPFADTINFENLNLVDLPPVEVLNLYDISVDTDIDLQAIGTSRIRPASLSINLVNGRVDTIDVTDTGYGYKVPPVIEFEGDGFGAKATSTIDSQGRVISVNVDAGGKKYNNIVAKVRNFSVLVKQDSTAKNFWTIYAWDSNRRTFYRTKTQSYDTTRYWLRVDWWKEGYGITSRIVKEISNLYEEPTIFVEVGDLIRVKEYANGGWAVFEKIANDGSTFSENYTMVGREKGTIEISSLFYENSITGVGYDNTQTFDTVSYDTENGAELRNVLTAVKENIFTNEYSPEWNNLFFTSVRYVFAEQQYVDWAFKTSFLNAIHNVGSLEQKTNYKNDNLSSFQDYIDEVKPYRTTVREYVSQYKNVDTMLSANTDFDLPPAYSKVDGKIVPITENSVLLNSYPWKWWYDNFSYTVTSIEVYDQGDGYITAPTVLIEGNGTGAEAISYISNGKVVGIKVINSGSGYTTTPTVTLVGGNSSNELRAKAVAILGDTKVRTFNMSIKFDRISKEGLYSQFNQVQTFTATGLTSVFDLNYAPTRDKSKIRVYQNDQIILNDQFSISLYKSTTDTYNLLKGKLIFVSLPAKGDIIRVEYEKNDELLDSVNRIQKYYAPTNGMTGKDLGQLMTGIDFGGVQIQGTTFDVTGGWDALPWFTDNWDSVESNSDFYVVCDGSTTLVTLPYTPADGQQITVYLKRAGSTEVTPGLSTDDLTYKVSYEGEIKENPTIRIDDPAWTPEWDSTVPANPNAQMPTFVGDGSTNVIEIGLYVSTNAGDTLIFRPIESDGSVIITDTNLLDTRLSGGSLAAMSGAYSTATGLNADEIVIDGSEFVNPDQVPAPEENVPGQVLESVSIRVFNSTTTGAAPIQSSIIISDGVSKVYNFGLEILEANSLLVYVNKIKFENSLTPSSTSYTIDYKNNSIEFYFAPALNSTIEIIAIGIGGVSLLDYKEFTADGTTNLFLTEANYIQTASVFVTLNGQYQDIGFVNSTEFTTTEEKTLIQFGTKPSANDNIKIICLGSALDVDSTGLSVIRVNKQQLVYDGSSRSFDLDKFVNLTRSSAESSVVVELNGKSLRGPDVIYETYNGSNNVFVLGTDPLEPFGSILISDIKVLINDQPTIAIRDYLFNGPTKELTINTSILNVGDIIKIENTLRSEYFVVNNNIVIGELVDLNIGDLIEVTWFSEYPTMGIITDEYSGGKINYRITQTALNSSYVWVYKNGERLIKEKDYYVSLPRNVLYLNEETTSSDLIKIVTFGSQIYKQPSAFEIHKDMLNIYHFKRFSIGKISLAKELAYYDKTLTVTDASELYEPIPSRNIPGILYVSGERIEYFVKSGNVLSQLRRGTQGTSIGLSYPVGTLVADISPNESLPYNENQERFDFISDGSTLLIGPLEFIPTKSTRNSWTKTTIPSTYGPCDEVEVFVAGTRMRKDPVSVYDETLGSSSPDADKVLEADFSVNGSERYIRLTNAPPAGTRISVIKRTGKIWYERGENTASSGVTLLNNNTAIARFIAQSTTNLPE